MILSRSLLLLSMSLLILSMSLLLLSRSLLLLGRPVSGCSAGNRRTELLTDCFIFYFPTESGTGCGQTKSKKRIFFQSIDCQ